MYPPIFPHSATSERRKKMHEREKETGMGTKIRHIKKLTENVSFFMVTNFPD